MKKLLFLVLVSVSIYGQTGKEQVMPKGLKVTNAVSTYAPFVTVQEVGGVLNKIYKTDLLDFITAPSAAGLPATGLLEKIYCTRDNNKIYRWTGVIYQELANVDISGKANIANPTFTTKITSPIVNISEQTASTLASFDALKNVVSLPLITYPSLAELACVKGINSSIQTQLNTINSATVVVSLNEGNGTGIVLAGRNALHFGNIGNGAIDFSKTTFNNSSYGATGPNSTAFNWFTTASGPYSHAEGSATIASGVTSHAEGESSQATANASHAEGIYTTASQTGSHSEGGYTVASGDYSNAAGYYTTANSLAETAIGMFNTSNNSESKGFFNGLDRIFSIGNGSGNSARSTALEVLKNGVATLPSVTNALITAESTGKAVVTKDWVEKRFETRNVSSLEYFQNTSFVPTIIKDMAMTLGVAGNYRVDFNGQFNTQLANITQQGAIDLNSLYLNINKETKTTENFPTFTNGSVVLPGVYETPGAVGPIGSITLDGKGDGNSIFIFRTIAAFSTGAGCVFNLINGANASNVFVLAGGAITLGAGSNFSGTLISNLAAIDVGSGAYLNGRVLSMAAAVSNLGTIVVPSGVCKFQMGVLSNFAIFSSVGAVSNVGFNIIVGDVGSNKGAVLGFENATHSGLLYYPSQGASLITFGIYVDGVLSSKSIRERVNCIAKEDVILCDVVTISANSNIVVKVTNSIGISRFYNRILTVTRI